MSGKGLWVRWVKPLYIRWVVCWKSLLVIRALKVDKLFADIGTKGVKQAISQPCFRALPLQKCTDESMI